MGQWNSSGRFGCIHKVEAMKVLPCAQKKKKGLEMLSESDVDNKIPKQG